MINKKKKMSFYELVMEEFEKDKERSESGKIKCIHHEIKEYYKEQVSTKKIDIKIEKIRLEKLTGKYNSELVKYNISFYIALMCAIFPLYFQELFRTTKFNNPVIILFILCSIIFVLIYFFSKESDKDKPKSLMLNLSLKVLEELEEELKETDDGVVDEVAITQDNKLDLILKNTEDIKRFLSIKDK